MTKSTTAAAMMTIGATGRALLARDRSSPMAPPPRAAAHQGRTESFPWRKNSRAMLPSRRVV